MAAAVLYTPEILGLATSLSEFPWDEGLPMRAEARSRSCGSTLALALATDENGLITGVGLRSHACAIGQASAAIFARAAVGKKLSQVGKIAEEIDAWLKGEGESPDWPGFAALSAARDYPARHGAIVLSWQAARALLSTREISR